MLTVQKILKESFQFKRGDGSVIAQTVYLLRNGKIIGINHFNEYAWSLEGGELRFHDRNGDVTTTFTEIDETDGLILSGFFRGNPESRHILTAHSGGRNHGRLLDVLPRKQDQKPMLILIRSHLVNNKLFDMVSYLNRESDLFDVAVVYDRTHGEPKEMPDVDVVWHSEAECAAMGLPKMKSRLLWWCGDFPFYFALEQKPKYEYYAMVEYDVHLTGNPNKFFEDLIIALRKREGKEPISALGPRFRVEDGPIGLHMAMRRKYDLAYSYFFPVIVLSKAAVSFLYRQRLLDGARDIPEEDIGHCESFVPTELIYNGFSCSDLNVVLPGTYDNDLMILPVQFGLPISMADGFEGRVRMIHPVYGDEQHLGNLLASLKTADEIGRFKASLDSEFYSRIPAATRVRVGEEAQKRLDKLATVEA